MKKSLLLKASVTLNVILACTLLFVSSRLEDVKAAVETGNAGARLGRIELFRLLDDSENEIIFLGDSITQQAEWSELLGNCRVKNRATGKATTSSIIGRLDEIVSSKPEKVFLMAGVNDLVTQSREAALDGVKEIISVIRQKSPETGIYVQSILPVNNDIGNTGRKNADIEFINDRLKTYCHDLPRVAWVDLRSAFVDEHGALDSSYTHDGLHLKGAAYLKWREIIRPYL